MIRSTAATARTTQLRNRHLDWPGPSGSAPIGCISFARACGEGVRVLPSLDEGGPPQESRTHSPVTCTLKRRRTCLELGPPDPEHAEPHPSCGAQGCRQPELAGADKPKLDGVFPWRHTHLRERLGGLGHDSRFSVQPRAV